MSNGTIIQQGRFTSTGVPTVLDLRFNPDWMKVENYTTTLAGGAGTGVMFEWRRGMDDGYAFEYIKLAADDSITKDVIAADGFTLVDTSENPLSAINATGTAISNAAPPVLSCASTAGIAAGDVIRLIDPTGAQQFGGVDFTAGTVNVNTDIELVFGPTIVAGTNVSFYKVKWAPIFYPRSRYISSITQAASAVVTLTVTHGYSVGQVIRFNVSSDYGMTEIDGLSGEITAINTVTNTLTVDIDTQAFTAFAWPLTAGVPFTHAKIVPVGEGSIQVAAGAFDGSVENLGLIGMILGAGTHGPVGINTNVIYWTAGKSLDVNNV